MQNQPRREPSSNAKTNGTEHVGQPGTPPALSPQKPSEPSGPHREESPQAAAGKLPGAAGEVKPMAQSGLSPFSLYIPGAKPVLASLAPTQRVRVTAVQELTEVMTCLHERMRTCAAEVRLEMLALLAGGPRDVSTLVRVSNLGMPTVSKALGALKESGLLASRAIENRRIYAHSRAISIEVREDRWDFRIHANHGVLFIIGIPERLMHSLLAQFGTAPEHWDEPVNAL